MYTLGEAISVADAGPAQDKLDTPEPSPNFGYDDLVRILTEQTKIDNGTNDNALTNWQLQQMTGRNDKQIIKRLRVLILAGKVECIKVHRKSDVTGDNVTIPAYRLIKTKRETQTNVSNNTNRQQSIS